MEDIFLGTPAGQAAASKQRVSLSPSIDAEPSTSIAQHQVREKHKKHQHKRSREEEETSSSKKSSKRSKKDAMTQVSEVDVEFDPDLIEQQPSGGSKDKKNKEERHKKKEEKKRRKSGGDVGAVAAVQAGIPDLSVNAEAAPENGEEGVKDKENKEEKRNRKEEKRRRKSGGDDVAATGDSTTAINGNGEVDGRVNGESSTQAMTHSQTSTKRRKQVGPSKTVRADPETEKDNENENENTPSSSTSSSPEPASQLRSEPSATPLVALTPNTAKRLLVTRPLRAPISASPSRHNQRSSKQSVPPISSPAITSKSKSRTTRTSKAGSSSAQGQSEDKVDDSTLKKRLNSPKAVEEWIANNWVTEGEMRRLERCGVLIYKKGKFSEDEKMAIRQALQNYQKVQRMNDHQLVDLIMSTKLNSPLDKEDWRSFWLDLAAVVPGRPVAYVQRSVQRMYDPKGHKGAWTPEEDDALMRAYVKYPNQWGKISEVVDRTLYDCRDRYTKELSRGSDRISGRWAVEEEEQLIASVKKINRSLGRDEWQEDDIPWELVAKDMGGKRSLKQCRVKWSEVVLPKRQGLGGDWTMGDRFKILDRIEQLNLRSEKHLDWKTIQSCGILEHLSTKQISNAYHHLKRGIANANSMSFDELLKAMRRHTADLQVSATKRIKSKARVVSDDEGEGEISKGNPRGKGKGKVAGKGQRRGEFDELESSDSESEVEDEQQVVKEVRHTDGMSSD
ncbi:hypothetical protein IAT40_003886 [Kwoniella sp. CBS 6097]